MSVGRNDPCPCGSAKKYKKCCLIGTQTQRLDDFSYRRFRDIEFKLIQRLFRHAQEVFGLNSIHEAWDEFHFWGNSEGYHHESAIVPVFGPFFLYSWEIDPDDTESDLALEGKTIAESFLEANRSRLSKEELEIIEASNRPVFTFYEIAEVIPGEGFSLRNILTEEWYDVVERSGSQETRRGDVMFGAIFDFNGRWHILAMSPFMLPPLIVQTLADLRSAIQERLKVKKLNDRHLAEYDMELREFYFDLLQMVRNPPEDVLCNSDGDPLLPQTLHFEITDPEEAFVKLRTLTSGMLSEEQLRADAKQKDGRIQDVEIPWFKKSKSSSTPGSNTVLGSIRINGTKLTVDVNSDKRAKTIKKKIETALASNVRFKTKVIEPVEANIDRPSTQSQPRSKSIPMDQLPPDARVAFKKMADAHWAEWFDAKIPALNGKTPKEAAQSKEGRELLEALLNTYEQRNSVDVDSTNLFKPDIESLRLTLGLT